METPKKFKLSRRLLIFVLPAVLIPTILFLIIMKGPDLGKSEEDAKATQKKQAERESLMGARVTDPEAAAKEEANRAALAAARNSLPPPPENVETKSDVAREHDLVVAKEEISKTLNDHERQGVFAHSGDGDTNTRKSFVAYTAPAKEGLGSGVAKSAKEAATIDADKSKPNEEPAKKPFLSANDDKVATEQSNVAKRIDGLYWIAPGTIIEAVLLNAVDTSVPGQVTARVTTPVYDSRYGRYLVVPAGTKLIGRYDSAIANGQERVMMSFNSMITPAGGVIDLAGVRSSDALGRVGIPGELHTFFWRRMGVATMLALESVGLDRLANRQTTVSNANGTSTTTNTSEAAKIIADAASQEPWMKPVAPKITIEEGQKISIVTVAHIEVPPVANKR
jgi:type IV secretory pathway VirB10-like protein